MQRRGLGRGLAALIPESKPEAGARPGPEAEDPIWEVPISQVELNPYQPRTVFDPEKMADLVASVREHGILQPILVRRMAPERYQLVAGERRFRAAEKAGYARVPAIIRECTDREQLEMAVVENLQREDIGAMEAARAYRRLIDEFHLTQDTVAQRVGKSRSAIANQLRLLRLPDEVQLSLEQGEITEGHARALMMAEFSQAVLHTWQEARKRKLSVRDTERLAKKWRNEVARGVPERATTEGRRVESEATYVDPNEADVTNRVQQALGTRVAIRRGPGAGGRIEIEFYSDEELQRLVEVLLTTEAAR